MDSLRVVGGLSLLLSLLLCPLATATVRWRHLYRNNGVKIETALMCHYLLLRTSMLSFGWMDGCVICMHIIYDHHDLTQSIARLSKTKFET
jgi:hypothetical protein